MKKKAKKNVRSKNQSEGQKGIKHRRKDFAFKGKAVLKKVSWYHFNKMEEVQINVLNHCFNTLKLQFSHISLSYRYQGTYIFKNVNIVIKIAFPSKIHQTVERNLNPKEKQTNKYSAPSR